MQRVEGSRRRAEMVEQRRPRGWRDTVPESAQPVVFVDCEARWIRDAISEALSGAGYRSVRVDAEGLVSFPQTFPAAVDLRAIVLDLSTHPWSGLARLELLRLAGHQQPVVALCPSNDALLQLEAYRCGASSVLEAPLDLAELLDSVERATSDRAPKARCGRRMTAAP